MNFGELYASVARQVGPVARPFASRVGQAESPVRHVPGDRIRVDRPCRTDLPPFPSGMSDRKMLAGMIVQIAEEELVSFR